MRGNLHNHSTYSDGIKTIEELNEMAIENNYDVIAITDHDTLDGYDTISKIDTKVRIITGVEMKCKYKGESVHILGYFSGKPDDNAIKYFDVLKNKRDIRCRNMLKKLKDIFNLDISYEEVKKLSSGAIGRPHIARAICNKYNISFDEAFDKYIGNNSPAYIMETDLDIEEVINFLDKYNALKVIAHPIQIKKSDFRELVKYNFDGIEAVHPDQDEEYSNMIREFAKENNLIVTGGADYHGDAGHRKFEKFFIEGNELDIFLSKLDNK